MDKKKKVTLYIVLIVVISMISFITIKLMNLSIEVKEIFTDNPLPRRINDSIEFNDHQLLPFVDHESDMLFLMQNVSFLGGEWMTFRANSKSSFDKGEIIKIMKEQGYRQQEKLKRPMEGPMKIYELSDDDLMFQKNAYKHRHAFIRVSIFNEGHSLYAYVSISN